jgi:predicted secreted protein
MDGQLVQNFSPSDSFPESVDLVEIPCQELVELRADRRRLERENLELRQQVGYWQSRHRDTLKRINALELKHEPTPMVFRALISA